MSREQDCKDEEDHYTAGIDRNLNRAEKLVVEFEVEGCGREKDEEQICGRTQDFACGDSQYREDDNRQGDYPIKDCTSY